MKFVQNQWKNYCKTKKFVENQRNSFKIKENSLKSSLGRKFISTFDHYVKFKTKSVSYEGFSQNWSGLVEILNFPLTIDNWMNKEKERK